jgi:hypothetical protein
VIRGDRVYKELTHLHAFKTTRSKQGLENIAALQEASNASLRLGDHTIMAYNLVVELGQCKLLIRLLPLGGRGVYV